MEYYPVLGLRLVITNIRELTKFGSVDESGNDFLLTNNITNTWRAVYNLYGTVWCHGLENNQMNTAKNKFVPYNDDNLDLES